MTTTFRFVLALAVALGARARAQTATELGPAPTDDFGGAVGRISAIAAHPTDANRYYVGGADGGVWRTTNGGASWTPLTDQMPTTSIGAIALDPTDANTIYAGTGESNFANHCRYGLGIYKSVDAGATWTQLGAAAFSGRCISRIIVSPANHSTLYASVVRAGGFPSLAAAKGHPQASGALGVFKSTDGGVNWTALAGGLPNLDATELVMSPTNAQVLYAAIGHLFGNALNGVYKTTDGGTTWAKLAGGLPTSGNGRVGLAIAPSNANRLYAYIANPADSSGGGASNRGVWRTSDAGTTWTQLGIAPDQSTYGWYFTPIAVNPTNADVLYLGGISLYRSTNAGSSISDVSPPHPDMHAITFDASGRLLVGNDGGFNRSATGTGSWQVLNTGLGVCQFYAGLSTNPDDPDTIFGGLQDNGSVRRDSSSLTWTAVFGGDGGWTQVSPSNPNIVFVEAQGTGDLGRSTDGGLTFSSVGSGLSGRNCFLPPYLADPSTPGRMLYGTERVWVSTNYGSSWTTLSPDLTAGGSAAIRALAIAPSDSNFVYAATNDHRILSSTNSGATFSLRLSDNLGWPRVTREITVHPYLPSTVYVCGARFGIPHLRRSTDGGANWTNIGASMPDIPVNVCAVDTRGVQPVVYAGTDAGLLRSTDGGASWNPFGVGFPKACVVDIRLEPARNRLIVGTQGRGAWRVTIDCAVDFNGDGFATGDDFDLYVAAFTAGDPASDFNGDGFVNGDDFDAFLSAFEAGC